MQVKNNSRVTNPGVRLLEGTLRCGNKIAECDYTQFYDIRDARITET